jgi:hypothetical protein
MTPLPSPGDLIRIRAGVKIVTWRHVPGELAAVAGALGHEQLGPGLVLESVTGRGGEYVVVVFSDRPPECVYPGEWELMSDV